MANFLVPSIPNLESCRYKVDHVIGQIWNRQEPTIHQWMPEAYLRNMTKVSPWARVEQ
jgi:hypothetical protein